MDSRTFLEKSDQIYNDNYLFLGAGFDYTGFIEGVRLSLQLGNSFDLNEKIHLRGFDTRVGFMTYHEQMWGLERFWNEIYSEAFYVRRYRNGLFNLQLRSVYVPLQLKQDHGRVFEGGPYLNGSFSFDTAAYDYNRFIEAQYGVRIRYRAPFATALHVLGVIGKRTEVNANPRNYQDFRLLLTGSYEI